MKELANRHVVVSGGTGGLGSAVVRQLLESGAVCHIPKRGRHEERAFALAEHESVDVVQGVDLTDEGSTRDFYDRLPEVWASIHCAGGFAMSTLTDTRLEDFQNQFALNTLSCFLCCREAVRRIRDRSGEAGGRIVNVAARVGLEPRGGAGLSAYTASKAALVALTQALAEELAPEEIWVNAVAPSIMDTPANRRAMPDEDHDSWPSVDDVARTIIFLASPQNRVTRGAVVPVYGRV